VSAPLRFLGLALVGWVGVRAATLGMVPGAEAFAISGNDPAPSPLAPAMAEAPSDPVAQPDVAPPMPAAAEAYAYGAYPYPYPGAYPYAAYGAYPYGYPPAAGAGPPSHAPSLPHQLVRPAAVPLYYYVPVPRPAAAPQAISQPAFQPLPAPQIAEFYAPIAELDRWDFAQAALPPWPVWRNQSGAAPEFGEAAGPPRRDRLQLSSWAMIRSRPGPQSLASGGMLGGSQAGARLTYALDPRLALSIRATSPVGAGASGGEIAGGIRVTPIPRIPLSLTAERRHAIGRYGGGRSAFALLAEGGLYQRPVGWGLSLDGYAQAGIVGMRSRDLFADGSLALTRPLYGPVSVGLGMWGGVQPDLYRLDIGPRASMRVRPNMRVHLDWRQRLVGNAEPGSGPAVTLAADF